GGEAGGELGELERLAVAAELLGDDRATQRELVVAEHGFAAAEVAVDQVGGGEVAEPERERATRVECADVPRVLDQRQGVGARGPWASRATSSHAVARSSAVSARLTRTPVSSLSAARSPDARCVLASVRNAAGWPGSARHSWLASSSAASRSPAASARSSCA